MKNHYDIWGVQNRISFEEFFSELKFFYIHYEKLFCWHLKMSKCCSRIQLLSIYYHEGLSSVISVPLTVIVAVIYIMAGKTVGRLKFTCDYNIVSLRLRFPIGNRNSLHAIDARHVACRRFCGSATSYFPAKLREHMIAPVCISMRRDCKYIWFVVVEVTEEILLNWEVK